MNWFRRSKVGDERIVTLQNKIYREIFNLITIIIAVSVLVKVFYFDLAFEHVLTELTILVISSLYYLFRSVNLGIFSDEVELHDRTNKRPRLEKNVLFSLLLGVVLAIVLGINSAISYGDGGWDTVYTFLIVFAATLVFYIPIFILIFVVSHEIAKKRSEKIIANQLEEHTDDGDEDEKH